jgi:hypothetical protein
VHVGAKCVSVTCSTGDSNAVGVDIRSQLLQLPAGSARLVLLGMSRSEV